MATTNIQTFSGDVDVTSDLNIGGETILGTATYRKRRDWNRNALAYVYLGNVRTSTTTGIRLDVSVNNSNSGYQMYSYYINLFDDDPSHTGGYMTYSCRGAIGSLYYAGSDIGYVYVDDGSGLYTYQLWLQDPTYSQTGSMDAYINCQGYYVFDTEVSDVAQGGAAPTNFNLGTPCVITKYTGNVGIGSTNPVYKLDVTGTAAISSNLTVGTANLHVDTNTGNIGIGKASPATKLDILLDSETGSSNTVGLTIRNYSSDHTSIANGFGSRINFVTNRGTSSAYSAPSADIKGYIYTGAGSTGDYHALDLDVYGDNGSLNRGISILSQSATGDPANTIMYGNVGIGTTNPSAQLTLGASSGSQIAVTDNTRLLSNTHYINYTSSTATDVEQVLLQFDTVGTNGADQSEYAGYIDVEMVAQRTGTPNYGPEIFAARLNYILGWNEYDDVWKITIVQENKSVSPDTVNTFTVFKSVPVFKYKYVDRQLQIYVSFNANLFRGYTSFTARVTSDAPADVTMPGPDALMASGTVGTAEVGICYGVGTNAANVGIGTTSPKQMFEVDSSGYGLFSGRLGVGNVLTSAQNGGGQNHWDDGTSAKLVVRCANNANKDATYANARAYAGIALVPGFDAYDTTNMGLWGTGSGENPVFYIQNQVNNGNNGGGYIALQPVGGNVGIGTTNPVAKLQVAGKSVISENISYQDGTRIYDADLSVVSEIGYSASGTADIDIGATTSQIGGYTSTYRYKLYTDVASGTSKFKIASVAGPSGTYNGYGTVTDRITLDNTGNVGIGTESPSYKLDVHGTANVGTLYSTLTYSNASANIVAWNTSTNEVIDSGLERGFTEHPVETFTGSTTYNANIGTSGEFPPSTHYIEGHGTYEAWASTQYNVSGQATREVWKLFDGSTSTFFQQSSSTDYDKYNVSSPYEYVGTRGTTTTDVGGTRYMGVWVQLKLPYTITLAYTKINNWTSNTDRSPGAGVILGSNDGDNWYKLSEFSGLTYTSNEEIVQVNATTPYQYYRMVTTNTVGTGTINFTEWRLFAEKPVTRMENVHISGDLSSETLQTGYIKWPKVPLKAAESEGYVVSASENSPYLKGILKPWKAFNNIIGQLSGWSTFGTRYNSDGTLITSTSFQGYDGHWLKISMPQSIVPSFMLFYPYVDGRQFMRAGKILASNDEITWDVISSFSDVIRGEFDFEPHRINISAHKSYSSFAVVVSENNGLGWLAIDEWEIYESTLGVGTSATTAKLTVDGGLGLAKGSQVFAGSDVVMELPRHDRPLVKYPEVAMTAATTAGYTASASRFDAAYYPYKAFNGLKGGNSGDVGWHTGTEPAGGIADYTGTSNTYVGTERLSSETVLGEWITIELPKPIKLKETHLWAQFNYSHVPKGGVFYGKRNASDTWTRLYSYTERSIRGRYNPQVHIINETRYFKYFAYVATERYLSASGISVGEWELYGYEEGDTSVDVVHRSIPNKPSQQHLEVYWDANDSNSYSFADSSNVYDLSGNGRKGTLGGGVGFDAEYNAWVFDGTDDYITSSDVGISGAQVLSMTGWLKTDSSGEVARFGIGTYTAARCMYFTVNNSANSYYIVCNANNNTYTGSFPANTWLHVTMIYLGSNISNTTLLLYINGVLQIPSTGAPNTAALNLPSPCELRLGRGIDGGYTSGSIANFRLYSKALSADQVRELYDYDAERFGHRQNVVALHKGNLGVGVAHPTSRFEVAGADGLQEYPPKAMTGYETYMEGHGVFRASASSISATSGRDSWKAFDKTLGGFFQVDNVGYNETTGLYEGSNVLSSSSGTPYGEYHILNLPYKIQLKTFNLAPRQSSNYLSQQTPVDGQIWGSNDGQSWYNVYNYSGLTFSSLSDVVYFDVNDTLTYSQYAIIVTKNGTGADAFAGFSIGELRYFGTPAPSSLEDGHLSLGKALTLPRVSGHPAGAETPRAESLVVHYDTTVDSVVSGSTVVDISGEGNNGTLYNGAAYSSTDRALTFDGGDDSVGWVPKTAMGISGDWVHSFSGWFKFDTFTTKNFMYTIRGVNTRNQNVTFGTDTTGKVTSVWYGNDIVWGAVQTNTWYHVCLTYPGSASANQKLYINGELQTITNLGSYSTEALNITSITDMRIGALSGTSYTHLDGNVSKIKFWNVALTAEEVAQEYALGRTGKSLNLTDTALCLGGTVPRAQLDVRGAAEISKLGIGVDRTNFPTLAPLTIHRNTYDGLGGGLELTRFNTPDGNGGLGYNRSSAIWHAYSSTNSRETLYFAVGSGDYGTSSYDYTRVRGYIDTNNSGGNITFTGQHRAVVEGIPIYESEKYKGLIVSSKSNKYVKLNGLETGSNAITINESVPLVSLSNIAQDKSCFGVISDSEDPDVREDRIGNFVTTGQKEKGDARVFINSVGEGAMWVVNTAGPLESGDYITTSNVAGYGQKQESDSLKNYTVAKITMDCDFEPATQPIQRIKQSNVVETHYTGLVPVVKGVPHEWVTTTVTADDEWSNVSVSPSDVTYAEWSNLEANVQNTYTLTYTQTSNVVYDVKYTKTTTANVTAEDAWDAVHIEPSTVTYAEYSNLEANVQNTYSLTYTMTTKVEATEAIYSNLSTEDKEFFVPTYYQMVKQTVDAEYPGAVKHETVTDRLENALDEHGQLQWEDDPSGATEKAYKIRYLDASSQITDEANAVHTAAFVGVTYHCG
jgi:hypothetical protein